MVVAEPRERMTHARPRRGEPVSHGAVRAVSNGDHAPGGEQRTGRDRVVDVAGGAVRPDFRPMTNAHEEG